MDDTPETFTYTPWRHGGWYVNEVDYAEGYFGCVSRNYPDRKWRIVCDPRKEAYEIHVYRTRDEAARAEYRIAQHLASGWLCRYCGEYFQKDSNFCGLCGHDLAKQRGKERS